MNSRDFKSVLFQINTILLFFLLLLLPTAPLSAWAEREPPTGSSLVMTIDRERVYPGESVPVTVTLTIKGATVRNIGFPTFANSQLTISNIRQLQSEADRAEGETRYQFSGQVIPARPGSFTFGPASISCEVMEKAKGNNAFFGGQEPHAVKLLSSPATLTVLPLPAIGKPETFSGAIGAFTLSVRAVPAEVCIGDPITVTSTIRGVGSLADASCPILVDSSMQSFPVRATRSASQLVCEQVVIPNRAIRFSPVTWNYFDANKGQYRIFTREVNSTVIVRPATDNRQTAPPTQSAADRQKPLLSLRFFLEITAGFLLVSVLVVFVRNRRKSTLIRTLPGPSNDIQEMLQTAENALSNGEIELFYNVTFAITQNSVDKLYSRSNGDTEVRSITASCDKVRYGRITPDIASVEADFEKLKQLIFSTLQNPRI